ncbi:TnsA-like heteromeric transposase endonuclease subunit [Nocardia tengchongensis]|uniref:TnsA-like heteromeric transposase endonuclease subunit n=1 Tax=Nocardia tengchongensis TaxID=2055889 RepID=UPI0033E82F22
MAGSRRASETPSTRAQRVWQPTNHAPYPQIGYIDPQRGRVIARIGPHLAGIAFETMAPICPVRTWPGQRNHESTYIFSRSDTSIRCGSGLQEQALMLLDFENHFDTVSAQPLWLLWPPSMPRQRHAPTFVARTRDGGLTVVDVRASAFIGDAHRAAFAATAAVCAELGWNHRLIETLDATVTGNLVILARCAHPRCAPPAALAADLIAAAGALLSIGELTDRFGGSDPDSRAMALTGIYHLLWNGRLRVRLDRPLTMASVIGPR